VIINGATILIFLFLFLIIALALMEWRRGL